MKRALALVVLLALAGCTLPQPFRHDGAAEQLARPKTLRGISLRLPVVYGPSAVALGEAVSKTLTELEIPSSTRAGVTLSHVLALSLEAEGKQAILTWTLSGPDTAVQEHKQRLLLEQWYQADGKMLKALARDCVGALIANREDPASISQFADAQPVPRLKVQIQPLTGLPGDGNSALKEALVNALRRGTLQLVEQGADYRIEPTITIDSQNPQQDKISLHWAVRRLADNKLLGAADQEGPVPKGRLSQPWGGLARDMALGGAEGVMDIIRADRP